MEKLNKMQKVAEKNPKVGQRALNERLIPNRPIGALKGSKDQKRSKDGSERSLTKHGLLALSSLRAANPMTREWY